MSGISNKFWNTVKFIVSPWPAKNPDAFRQRADAFRSLVCVICLSTNYALTLPLLIPVIRTEAMVFKEYHRRLEEEN